MGSPLIIGLTGPIGAGCTYLAEQIIKFSRIGPPRKWISDYLNEVVNEVKCLRSLDFSNVDNKEQHIKLFKNKLQTRNYLQALEASGKLDFESISMSELIVKACFEHLDHSEEWAKSSEARAKIIELLKDHFDEVVPAISVLENNQHDFDKGDYSHVDEALKAISNVTKSIKQIETIALAESEEDYFILQELGDNLRGSGNPFCKCYSNLNISKLQIIAREVDLLIEFYLRRNDNRKRNNFVIDAFRNPSEIDYFRNKYSRFFLISINAQKPIRQERFTNNLKTKYRIHSDNGKKIFEKVDRKDSGEETYSFKESNVQAVSECSYMADIAMTNNTQNPRDIDLFRTCLRYIALLLYPGCTQPTHEETMMNLAYSLSLRSSCISRQVGAVITDNEGYVLGQGWNDCGHGQIGCGLITVDDYLNLKDGAILGVFDKIISDFNLSNYDLKHSICFKDHMSMLEITNICNNCENVSQLKIKRLEYCRALHAEENAILQVSRKGGMGVMNGIIYTTTFPCEICAKKILQSGITTIIYTEPYPGSISENVFLKDGIEVPETKQFEGVKFTAYYKLFKPRFNKKEKQRLGDNL